jgi:hypothetical protein
MVVELEQPAPSTQANEAIRSAEAEHASPSRRLGAEILLAHHRFFSSEEPQLRFLVPPLALNK